MCQHGPEECAGNMIQSCTLNGINGPLNGNPDASMAYVACQMAPGAEPTGREVVFLRCQCITPANVFIIS